MWYIVLPSPSPKAGANTRSSEIHLCEDVRVKSDFELSAAPDLYTHNKHHKSDRVSLYIWKFWTKHLINGRQTYHNNDLFIDYCIYASLGPCMPKIRKYLIETTHPRLQTSTLTKSDEGN